MDKKEEKSLKAKIYYQKNKERIKERVKARAENLKEEKKQYDKAYFSKNAERLKQRNLEYRKNNMQQISNQRKNRLLTAEGREAQFKYYAKKNSRLLTIEGKQAQFKSNTRHMKILEGDFKRYDNCKNCEICGIEFIKKKVAKCLDHDHISNYVRFICCSICNTKLGCVDRRKHILHLEFYRKIIYDNNK